jgi:leucyl-tRNA synthetase
MAQYYTDEGRLAVKGIGFSVDWRREFTTVMPTFQKFVEWQYKNLKKRATSQGEPTQSFGAPKTKAQQETMTAKAAKASPPKNTR